MCTVPGEGLVTVQLPPAAKLTGKPEVAVALMPKSAAPKVWSAMAAKLIVWLPLVFVRLKKAAPVIPTPLATTLYGPPAMPLAVAEALAWPLLIVALIVVTLPGKVALAPLPGAVKV